MKNPFSILEVVFNGLFRAVEWTINTLSTVTDAIIVRTTQLLDEIRTAVWRAVNTTYKLAVQLWRLCWHSLYNFSILAIILLAVATPLIVGQELRLFWLQLFGWGVVCIVLIAFASGALSGMKRSQEATKLPSRKPLLWSFASIDLVLTVGLLWWTAGHAPQSLYGKLVGQLSESVHHAQVLEEDAAVATESAHWADSLRNVFPIDSTSSGPK